MDQTCQGEFWTIPLHKTVSVQHYSWDVWCVLLSTSCHSISNRVEVRTLTGPLEDVFSSVEAILLLIYFCVLGLLSCCITQLLLSFNWRTDSLTFSWKKTWEFIFPSMIASCPGPEAAKQLQTMMLPSPYFTVDEVLMLVCFFLSTHSFVRSFQTTQL